MKRIASVFLVVLIISALSCSVASAEKVSQKALVENYWESFVQSYEIYQFNADGTGVIYGLDPICYYDKSTLTESIANGYVSANFNYEIDNDGNLKVICYDTYDPNWTWIFNMKYINDEANINWDLATYHRLPEKEYFFYEADYNDEIALENAMYLVNTHIKSENRFEEKEIKVVLNGQELSFDQPPVIINDRTMVPIRAIFEAMGYAVEWNQNTKTATATKGIDKIVVQIGNHIISYTTNGVSGTYYCDVAPQIISDRTLVPVRAIAESAGCNVDWDGNTKTVYINK
ncbi:MAG: copper amine oxidase N-terminal domain-containing protein [Ruminococcaceae bacterium]|nr:copper amine oxidase N-terminal domain-containing protein [Oscillospiraceae bacterium]